jgi:hypothetical protein
MHVQLLDRRPARLQIGKNENSTKEQPTCPIHAREVAGPHVIRAAQILLTSKILAVDACGEQLFFPPARQKKRERERKNNKKRSKANIDDGSKEQRG